MASYEITLNSEQLSGLLTDDKGLQGLVAMTCPLIMRPVDMLGLTRIDRRHDERQAIFRRADDSDFT
jgi:hypothetical protein